MHEIALDLPFKKGLPATKHMLSRLIVKSSDLATPLGVKAHSTRSMAASKAFLSGVSLQDACDQRAGPLLTFVRSYNLDLGAHL